MLTELEKRVPGFHRHVRLVSGASGGMLGAAAWRAWLREPDRLTVRDAWQAGLEADFLSPLVQGLAFKDVPMTAVCPFGYWDDRGRRLERAWEKQLGGKLNITLGDLRDEEATGRFPSLVFTPMMVEDGRPLYVSALGLDDSLATAAWAVTETADGDAAAGGGGVHARNGVRSRTRGLELHTLFPDAGWNLRLGTAARLSASFPYFSPAAVLPTAPPRRLVDAGYLDNFGMAVALGWTYYHTSESQLLAETCSRVVIVELRPYGRWEDTADTAEERAAVGDAWLDEYGGRRVPSFVGPVQELTTPPEGGEAARKAGMIGRNEEQFAALRELGYLYGVPVERVVLKGELDSALNWTLPARQITEIYARADEGFADPRRPAAHPRVANNVRELSALVRYLSGDW